MSQATPTRADFIRTSQHRLAEQCVALRDEAQALRSWRAAGSVAELSDYICAALGRLAIVAEDIESRRQQKREEGGLDGLVQG